MGPSQKDKLNIKCCAFVKKNKVDGQIIAVVPDVPISAFLNELLFIITLPSDTDQQKFTPAYIRLQNKTDYNKEAEIEKEEIKEFTEVRATGVLISKIGDMIVCAPTTKVRVDLDKLVLIATVPAQGKASAPCYFRKKTFSVPSKEHNKESAPPANEVEITEIVVEEDNTNDNSEMS